MDIHSNHVVIIGGPEDEEELLAIVLDDGQAIPLFGSTDEAGEFLASLGEFADDWRAVEVAAPDLAILLEYQDEEVGYVALSPPPEDLTGGMEVQVLEREVLTEVLRRQSEPPPRPEERKGFFQRLLGR